MLDLSNGLSAATTALDQAHQRYAAGDFTAAANAYEQVLTSDGPRAAVFYDLGNCYQRLGQYGPAILAYERARLLTPRNPDLLANLTLARKAATAFEEPGLNPRLDALLNPLSRNEWSWLVTGAALFLGGLALVRGAVSMPRRWLRQACIVAAVVAGIVIVWGAAALHVRRAEANRGIVLTATASVRLSPFASAESLGTPGPGRNVQLGQQSGHFIYVTVPGTKLCGWMADTDVAAITPPDRSGT